MPNWTHILILRSVLHCRVLGPHIQIPACGSLVPTIPKLAPPAHRTRAHSTEFAPRVAFTYHARRQPGRQATRTTQVPLCKRQPTSELGTAVVSHRLFRSTYTHTHEQQRPSGPWCTHTHTYVAHTQHTTIQPGARLHYL